MVCTSNSLSHVWIRMSFELPENFESLSWLCWRTICCGICGVGAYCIGPVVDGVVNVGVIVVVITIVVGVVDIGVVVDRVVDPVVVDIV